MAFHRSLNYCPTCGHSLEDRLAFGRMRRYCPTCETIIFRDHKVAAGVLVERNGHILLVRRRMEPRRGRWTFPAGFVDYDEAPADAAIRECREETGLEVEITGLLDVIAGREHPHGADIVIVYLARQTGGELHAADDADRAGFFPSDRLPPLAFQATKTALESWRRGKQSKARGGSQEG